METVARNPLAGDFFGLVMARVFTRILPLLYNVFPEYSMLCFYMHNVHNMEYPGNIRVEAFFFHLVHFHTGKLFEFHRTQKKMIRTRST